MNLNLDQVIKLRELVAEVRKDVDDYSYISVINAMRETFGILELPSEAIDLVLGDA